jgi:hypothetical protein
VFAAATAALMPCGCTTPKGGLVLSISTDMQTPKDFNVVSVFIATDSVPKFDYLGRVLPDGTVAIPATLAVIEPDKAGAQVHIRVTAFQEDKARVLRDVLTTVPHQRTALLRLPLGFLDDGSGTGTIPSALIPLAHGGAPEGTTTFDALSIRSKCDFSQGLTSIDGQCKSAKVDSSQLPDYRDTAVFGDGGLMSNGAPSSCFEVATCFAGTMPLPGLDAQGCTAPLPSGTTAATLNIALATPSTGVCSPGGPCLVPLDEDPLEGWSVSGNVVTMNPGVCAQLARDPKVSLVYSSTGGCAPKTPSNPVCEPTGADASSPAGDAPGPTQDATVDGVADAVVDALVDSTVDAVTDATLDAGLDATADAGPAGGQDATSGGVDAPAADDGGSGDSAPSQDGPPPADGGCGPTNGVPAGTPCGSADGGAPSCGGNCTSHVCEPDPDGGEYVCQPAAGCHPMGDTCTQDSDCCGSAGMPGAGTTPVTCSFQSACGIGVCTNATGCMPAGEACKLTTSSCAVAANCCSRLGAGATGCAADNTGVGRCMITSDGGCGDAGASCASSADCCGGSPCVPSGTDAGAPLVCGAASCQAIGSPCTNYADCCVGSVCTGGTCTGPGQTCPLPGQVCTVGMPCCSGAICSTGRCPP